MVMARFAYRALNSQGQMEEGVIEAPDLSRAKEILKSQGLVPVRITIRMVKRRGNKRLTLPEVVLFCRQLAVILSAGVSLGNGLNMLRQQRLTPGLKAEVERLFMEVQTGRLMSEAMADEAERYPRLLINIIAMGEISGNLDEVMSNMAGYYEREVFVRQKMRNLMIYPAILFVAATALIFFFINFLLPELQKIFKESSVPLPAITRLVITVTDFLHQQFPLLILLFILLLLFGRNLLKKPQIKYYVDRFLLKIPALGALVAVIIHGRFCRTLALLLRSGLPLMTALEAVERVVEHSAAGAAIRRAREGLHRGEPLAVNLATERFFEPLLIQFIAMGEETGELENVLQLMARNYDQQTELLFSRLTSVIEPALTLVMGVVVGAIVLSVLLPMFSMLDALRR